MPCLAFIWSWIHDEYNTREFLNLDQFPAIITKIQQDFDSQQWSVEVHLSKISF